MALEALLVGEVVLPRGDDVAHPGDRQLRLPKRRSDLRWIGRRCVTAVARRAVLVAVEHDFSGKKFDTIVMTDVLTVNPINQMVNQNAPLTLVDDQNYPVLLRKTAALINPEGGQFVYGVPDILDDGKRFLRAVPLTSEFAAACTDRKVRS